MTCRNVMSFPDKSLAKKFFISIPPSYWQSQIEYIFRFSNKLADVKIIAVLHAYEELPHIYWEVPSFFIDIIFGLEVIFRPTGRRRGRPDKIGLEGHRDKTQIRSMFFTPLEGTTAKSLSLNGLEIELACSGTGKTHEKREACTASGEVKVKFRPK